MAVPSNTSPPGEWIRKLISDRSPSALRSRANCWAVIPHMPTSSYSRISASPLASALMLYQLSLGWFCAVRAAVGASSAAMARGAIAHLFILRIGASLIVGCGHEFGTRHFEIPAVEVHQLPRFVGGDHLPDTEVGFLYGLNRAQAFFLRCVIGVRTEYQPRFAVGLDLGSSAALEFLRVAAAGPGYFGLVGKAGFNQQLPGVSFVHRVDPGHDRALIHRAEDGAWIHVSGYHDLPGGNSDPQPLAEDRPAPVVDKFMLQKVVSQMRLYQLLTLCAIGAVVAS